MGEGHRCEPGKRVLVYVPSLKADIGSGRVIPEDPARTIRDGAFLTSDGPAGRPLQLAIEHMLGAGSEEPGPVPIDILLVACSQEPAHPEDTLDLAEGIGGRFRWSAIAPVPAMNLGEAAAAVGAAVNGLRCTGSCSWYLALSGATALTIGSLVGVVDAGITPQLIGLKGGSAQQMPVPDIPREFPYKQGAALSALTRLLLRTRHFGAAARVLEASDDSPQLEGEIGFLKEMQARQELRRPACELAHGHCPCRSGHRHCPPDCRGRHAGHCAPCRLHHEHCPPRDHAGLCMGACGCASRGCVGLPDAVTDAVLTSMGRGDATAYLGVRTMIAHLYDRLPGACPGALRTDDPAENAKRLHASEGWDSGGLHHDDTGEARGFRMDDRTWKLWKKGAGTHVGLRSFDPAAIAHLRSYSAALPDLARDLAGRNWPGLPIGPRLPTGKELYAYNVGLQDSPEHSPFLGALTAAVAPGRLPDARLIAVGSTVAPLVHGDRPSVATFAVATAICRSADRWGSATGVGVDRVDRPAECAAQVSQALAEHDDADSLTLLLGPGTLEMNVGLLFAGLAFSMRTGARLRLAYAKRQGRPEDGTLVVPLAGPVLATDDVLAAAARAALQARELDLAASILRRGSPRLAAFGDELDLLRQVVYQPASGLSADQRSWAGQLLGLSSFSRESLTLSRLQYALGMLNDRPWISVLLGWAAMQGSLGKEADRLAAQGGARSTFAGLRSARNKSPLSHGLQWGEHASTRPPIPGELLKDAAALLTDQDDPGAIPAAFAAIAKRLQDVAVGGA